MKSCKWKQSLDGSYYDTQCRNTFQFAYDGVRENSFKYCPYCGKSIDDHSSKDTQHDKSISIKFI